MNLVERAIINIQLLAAETTLYKEMMERGGKFAIHKGHLNPEILFIGEAPGQNEDKQGIPFVGRSGKVLEKWRDKLTNKTSAVINTIPIMPTTKEGKIRPPTKTEIKFFLSGVTTLISALKPKNIILMGRSANKIYSKEELKNMTWKKQRYNIGFIYHPSYYIRNGRDGLDDFEILIERMPK